MPCEGKPKTGLQTMNLRRAEKGQLPPGTSENHLDDLDIEDEPPGGLWQAEGMTGPGVAPQERWAKGCEPTKEEDEDESEGEGEEAEELPTWIIKAAEAREKKKGQAEEGGDEPGRKDKFWREDEAEFDEDPAEVDAALEAELHMCWPGLEEEVDEEMFDEPGQVEKANQAEPEGKPQPMKWRGETFAGKLRMCGRARTN